MKKFARLSMLALAAALACTVFAACNKADEPVVDPTPVDPDPEPAAFVPYEFTDSCGNTITITEPITRVAVSGPTAQQVMLTFAPDTLVGLSTTLSPEQMKYMGDFSHLPVFGQIYGGKGSFNKEAVAEAMPQILIDWGEAKGDVAQDMKDLSAQLGIPCVHIDAKLETYDKAFTMLGQLLNMPERGAELADYCAKAIADSQAILAKLSADRRVSGVMTIMADNLGVIAKDSYQSQVFDMWVDNIAVFDNPSAKGTGNATDLEQMATWDPQFILFAPGDLYEEATTDAVWGTLTAIKTGNFIEIPGYPYNWMFGQPSVNQVLGMQWLPRVLYPELCTGSVQDVVTEYYKLFYGYDLSAAEFQALVANSQLK